MFLSSKNVMLLKCNVVIVCVCVCVCVCVHACACVRVCESRCLGEAFQYNSDINSMYILIDLQIYVLTSVCIASSVLA